MGCDSVTDSGEMFGTKGLCNEKGTQTHGQGLQLDPFR